MDVFLHNYHLISTIIHLFVSLSVGLKTSVDAHFYATSAKFDSFSNRDKTIVVQFTVKHEQKIDCGGGYVKVSH